MYSVHIKIQGFTPPGGTQISMVNGKVSYFSVLTEMQCQAPTDLHLFLMKDETSDLENKSH
jgi:hypothetical protein